MPVNVTLLRPDQQAQPATRTFQQRLAAIMNSLLQQGIIELVSVSATGVTWGVTNLFYAGPTEPAATTGFPGDYYFDFNGMQLFTKS